MTALYGNVTITDRIMTKAGLSRDSPVIDILFEAHQKIIGGDSITPPPKNVGRLIYEYVDRLRYIR